MSKITQVLYAICCLLVGNIYAMKEIAQTGEQEALDQGKIILVSNEGASFAVVQTVAELSKTIQNLIQDTGITTPIPLPNVDTKNLTKIATILDEITKEGEQDFVTYDNLHQLVDLQEQARIKTIIKNYFPGDVQGGYELLMMVNYLDIPLIFSTMKDLLGQKINESIKLFEGPSNKFVASIKNSMIEDNDSLWWKYSKVTSISIDEQSDTGAFSFDGQYCAIGTNQGNIKLYEVQKDYEFVGDFIGHSKAIAAVIFMPDNKTLVSASYDKTIKFWDVGTRAIEKEFKVDSGIHRLALSLDGKKLAGGGRTGEIIVWDLEKDTKQTFDIRKSFVSAIQFLKDQKHIIYGDWGGSITVLNSENGNFKNIYRDELKDYFITSIGNIFKKDEIIFTTTRNEVILLKKELNGTYAVKEKKENVGSSLSLSPNENIIALCMLKGIGSVAIWDMNNNALIKEFDTKTGVSEIFAFSPDNTLFVTGDYQGYISFCKKPFLHDLTIQQLQVIQWKLDNITPSEESIEKALKIYENLKKTHADLLKQLGLEK